MLYVSRLSGFAFKPSLINILSKQMSGQLTCCALFFELHKFAMCNRCPSAKELKTILLPGNYSVYHSVEVLQGSANSAFAGRFPLELKTVLRSTLAMTVFR